MRLVRRQLVPLVLLSCCLIIPLQSAAAQSSRATTIEIEAAYLYNFARFVNWPPDQPSGAFEICVLGKDPFGEVLDSTVAGETINSRKVMVDRITSTRDISACQIVFISGHEESRLKTILATVNAGCLTVSDIPHFAERGGMIELVERDGRIRFEVNLDAAQRAHVALSSELLKVAVKVIDKPGPGGRR
jgi:hypothetical protein